jgi:hypothetical protein
MPMTYLCTSSTVPSFDTSTVAVLDRVASTTPEVTITTDSYCPSKTFQEKQFDPLTIWSIL